MPILTVTAAATSEASASVDSRYGGTLTVADFNTYPGFCIGSNPDSTALGAYRAIYDTLVERNSDDGFTPFLAESVTPSNGNLTWTIRLRSGVKFHDGSALDANVLKLNIDSFRGIPTGSIPATRVLGIANVGLTNIMDVAIVDPLTVAVTLELPQIDFIETLYMGGKGFIRGTAQLNSTNCSSTPIGTGPFKLVSFTYASISLSRNADYWRFDPVSGNQLPYLDQLNFVSITNPTLRVDAIAGSSNNSPSADVAMFSSIYHPNEITSIRAQHPELREYKTRNDSVLSFYMNAGKVGSPLRNKNARLAIAYATNTRRFLSVQYLGLGEVPTSLIPRRSEMYTNENFPSFDLERAKQYVAAYKAETGATSLDVTIPGNTSSRSQETWQLLKSMLAEAGISLTVAVEESAVIIAKAVNAGKVGAEQNAYDMVPLTMSFGSETGYNSQFYRSDAFNPNTAHPYFTSGSALRSKLSTVLNFSHQMENTMDEKLLLAHSQTSQKSASARFRDAMAYYQGQAYAVPVVNGFLSVFASGHVSGFGTSFLAPGVPEKYMNSGGPNWAVLYKTASDNETRNLVNDGSIQNEVWTGGHPQGIVKTGNGVAYVARTDEGEICKVTLTTLTLASCSYVGGRPIGLVADASARYGYFLDSDTDMMRRLEFSSGDFVDVVTIPAKPFAIAINADSRYALVSSVVGNSVYRIDLTVQHIVGTILVPGGPSGIAIADSGHELWVSQSLLNKVIKISLGTESVASAAAAKNQALSSEIATSQSILRTIDVGSRPTGLKIINGGSQLLVVNENDDTLSLVSTSQPGSSSTIFGGNQPRYVEVDAETNRAYVSNVFSNSISQVQLPIQEPPVSNIEAPSITPPTAYPSPPTNVSNGQVAQVPTYPVSNTTNNPVIQFRIGVKVSTTSIIKNSKLSVPSGAKVRIVVNSQSTSTCVMSGSSVKPLKAGTCKVAITVTPKTGKSIVKTISIKVTK